MGTAASFIDLGIVCIVGISVFIGVLRGATREILGILGWIGAFCTVFYGLPLFRPLGRHYIHNPMAADACVGVILFVLSLTVFIIISRSVSSGVKGSLLSGLDRSLGLIFGFVRGVFVVCLVYMILGFFYASASLPLPFQESRLIPWVAEGAAFLKELVPSEYLPETCDSADSSRKHDRPLSFESLPNLEETVKNLSVLKPISSPRKLEQLIEKYSHSEEN